MIHVSKKVKIISGVALGLILTFTLGMYVGQNDTSRHPLPTIANTQSSMGTSSQIDFAPFWKAWSVLDEKFVGTSTKDQDKLWGAIKGLTESYGDPYTVFFPPEESEIFESEISGNFEGVGMEVALKDNRITVVAPLKGTPAEKAGIRAGDKILEIDTVSTEGLPVEKCIKMIRGKKGTTVNLLVERTSDEKPLMIPIVRGVIDIPTIKTEYNDVASSGEINPNLKGSDVFVIRLYSFSANSANLFRKSLQSFVDSKSHKLILDLRGNPGGYLDAAVDMASWFLPKGEVIVREEFGGTKEGEVYRSKGYNIFDDKLKMIILVDGGSASASEILAGALSEHGKAKLLGNKTFGKGSVQELINLTPETSLKVTIAKWLTPNGVSISKNGIVPEYVVEVTEKDVLAKKDVQMNKAIELLSR